MITFPVVTALVLAMLAWSMASQYVSRGRPQQLAWSVALACGFVATAAFVGSVLFGGNPWLFRVYYLGGAVLNAPLLGVGSTLLLPRRGWFVAMAIVTAAAAVVAAIGLAALPLPASLLAGMGIQPGTTVVTSVIVIIPVIIGNSLATVAVAGVALWSVWRSVRGQRGWGVTFGNALIAGGTLIIAAAGSLARLGHGAGFWGAMAVGWVVLYGGVRLMAVRLAARPEAEAA